VVGLGADAGEQAPGFGELREGAIEVALELGDADLAPEN
jgi:hypothetical protein